jgi:hypothetical protein
LFAVPIEALHVDADGDHVVLDVPKESFNESLAFDDKNIGLGKRQATFERQEPNRLGG